MEKLKPKRIFKGSKIGLIAPSGKINIEKFDSLIENIEKLGFKPQYTDRIFKRHGYLAGTDKNRLDDLHENFENKNIDAIFCIRGGYGATRIVDKIDYNLISQNPKIFLGFSDITALQFAFYKYSNLISFHGIVGAASFSDYTVKNFDDIFLKKATKIYLKDNQFNRTSNVEEFEYYTINNGIAKGKIIGGNLSLMVSLLGTKYSVDYQDKIVFIEEIDEASYKIDRMLTHLFSASNIGKAAAIVLGVFRKCSNVSKNINPSESLTLKYVFTEKFSQLKIPVVYGFSFGHINQQSIFPIGINAEIDTFNQVITFKERLFSD